MSSTGGRMGYLVYYFTVTNDVLLSSIKSLIYLFIDGDNEA